MGGGCLVADVQSSYSNSQAEGKLYIKIHNFYLSALTEKTVML